MGRLEPSDHPLHVRSSHLTPGQLGEPSPGAQGGCGCSSPRQSLPPDLPSPSLALAPGEDRLRRKGYREGRALSHLHKQQLEGIFQNILSCERGYEGSWGVGEAAERAPDLPRALPSPDSRRPLSPGLT